MTKKNELGYTFNQVWAHIAKELESNYLKLNKIHPKQHNYDNFSSVRSKQQAHL